MTTSSFKNTGSYKKETEPPTLKPLAPRPVDECSPFLTAWPPTPPSLRAPLLGRDWTPGLPLPLNKAPQSRQMFRKPQAAANPCSLQRPICSRQTIEG